MKVIDVGSWGDALQALADALWPPRPDETDDEFLSAVDPELVKTPHELALLRLQDVCRRGVPLTRLEPGPVQETARAVFADGSVILVSSLPQRHLLPVAVACLRRRVRVELTRAPGTGSDLERDGRFTWDRGTLDFVVVGPDQSD